MAGSVFDSALYSNLFPTGEVGRLFTDTAETRAMMLVEGSLAKVQGAQGIIPDESAGFVARAAMELQVDSAGLAKATGQNGVSVPAMVAAFRTLMLAPEHAQYLHWGATSQDIIDTGLMLRLRQALTLIEADLTGLLQTLATLAQTHAALPMAARTWGQHATPTSFGAVVANWGAPLLGLVNELPVLRRDCLLVSLSGAAGTASALGSNPAETRSNLAVALGLNDPGHSWHTDRSPVLRIADWMTRPEAQAVVKSLCAKALAEGTPLRELVAQDWPDLDAATLFETGQQMGQAPTEARNFATLVSNLQQTTDD